LLEQFAVRFDAFEVAEREAGADKRVGQSVEFCDANTAFVEVGAAAARGGEEVVARGVIDDGLRDDAFVGEGDRDAVVLEAVDEVGRAVEWVDDPLILGFLVVRAGFKSARNSTTTS
jgi:hypothetical protein